MPRYLNRLLSLTPAGQPELLGPSGGPPPKFTIFAEINGTEGDNILSGTASADVINGLGGQDHLSGLGGDDEIYGGDGPDTCVGGLGVDTLEGGAGDDTLNAVVNGVVFTSSPSDFCDGGSGVDTLFANYLGVLVGGQQASVTLDMSTGTGQVAVNGLMGESFVRMEKLLFSGADGNDHATGGEFSDSLNGRGGDDILIGAGGDDGITDSWGAINASGGDGNDTITLLGNVTSHKYGDININADSGVFTQGGSGLGTIADFENLIVYTGDGNDTITGFLNGVNNLYGATLGNKTFTGGNLDDQLTGGSGDVLLYGGGGNDRLSVGSTGVKEAYGGAGDDNFFNGGSGSGWQYGGGGNDTFFSNLFAAGAGADYDCGSGNDTVQEMAFAGTVNYTHTYLGGTGYDILSLVSDGEVMNFTAATIDGFEELQLFNGDTEAGSATATLSSAQFLSFDVIQVGADGPDGAFLRVTFADNGDIVLPDVSAFHELVLADGGQVADLSGVGSALVPKVVGGDGNDTVIGSNKKDRIEGGDGKDDIAGGGNKDMLTGGAGADTIEGGAGSDTLQYKRAGDSTGKAFDTVAGFDFSAADVFDLKGEVTGIDTKVNSGTLSKATINTDLAAAIGAGELDVDHAVLFRVTAGDYANKTFLIVDLNGEAGYQANKDLVVLLQGPVNLNSLDTADFT
jgi:Ca2+-binding RTX toxin-like protein